MTELTNLLPPDRIANGKRDYFLRLATVGVLMLSGVIVTSGALLFPSYLYLTHDIEARKAHVQELEASIAASHGQETGARLADLSATATYLSRLASTTAATAAMRGVLAVPRNGITLTGIIFTPPTHGNDGKMALTGMATTRESLRAYNDALSALPFVSNADLPISAYAKDSSIPFTITLTGTLTP